MQKYLVTLTNTKTWSAVKLSIDADSEPHALSRGLLIERHKHKGNIHHMVTISLVGSNPSVDLGSFDTIKNEEIEVFERIDLHNRFPLIEGGHPWPTEADK